MKPIKTMEFNMPKPPSDVLWQRKDVMFRSMLAGALLSCRRAGQAAAAYALPDDR